MIKRILLLLGLLLSSNAWAENIIVEEVIVKTVADKADNAFMMICTVLVLFMSVPGIALFYGGLLRSKNILSMLSQVLISFSLIAVLWVIYG